MYERAVDFFGDDHMDEKLFIAFAKFEEGQKEHERATAIYKFALEYMSKDKAADLYKAYTIHQKKFGERDAIEDVIVSKRKFQYEEEIKDNPSNYDAWFDYLRLLESEGMIRFVFILAISFIKHDFFSLLQVMQILMLYVIRTNGRLPTSL